jgi:hypothetical protein
MVNFNKSPKRASLLAFQKKILYALVISAMRSTAYCYEECLDEGYMQHAWDNEEKAYTS